ncbi:MAG: 6-pyruvoyl tetrahydropterin synthase family protein [Candidatus Eisenbacteria bacterium]
MYTIEREISFSYGHRLVGYPGKCARLHGHNGVVTIELAAERLDAQGMVLDFTEIKRLASGWIEATLDHRLILAEDDPAAALLRDAGEEILIVPFPPTAENLSRYIFEQLAARELPLASVTLRETPGCAATYRPARGDRDEAGEAGRPGESRRGRPGA